MFDMGDEKTAKPLSKAAQKRHDDRLYQDQMAQVIDRATIAAQAAFDAACDRMPKDENGIINDVCGFVSMYMFTPSSEFRRAGKALGILSGASVGYWYIGGILPSGINSIQALTPKEEAATAAVDVLRAAYPNESIYSRGRMD